MHKHIKYTNTYTHARRQTYMGDKHTYKQYIPADIQGQSNMQATVPTYIWQFLVCWGPRSRPHVNTLRWPAASEGSHQESGMGDGGGVNMGSVPYYVLVIETNENPPYMYVCMYAWYINPSDHP